MREPVWMTDPTGTAHSELQARSAAAQRLRAGRDERSFLRRRSHQHVADNADHLKWQQLSDHNTHVKFWLNKLHWTQRWQRKLKLLLKKMDIDDREWSWKYRKAENKCKQTSRIWIKRVVASPSQLWWWMVSFASAARSILETSVCWPPIFTCCYSKATRQCKSQTSKYPSSSSENNVRFTDKVK